MKSRSPVRTACTDTDRDPAGKFQHDRAQTAHVVARNALDLQHRITSRNDTTVPKNWSFLPGTQRRHWARLPLQATLSSPSPQQVEAPPRSAHLSSWYCVRRRVPFYRASRFFVFHKTSIIKAGSLRQTHAVASQLSSMPQSIPGWTERIYPKIKAF